MWFWEQIFSISGKRRRATNGARFALRRPCAHSLYWHWYVCYGRLKYEKMKISFRKLFYEFVLNEQLTQYITIQTNKCIYLYNEALEKVKFQNSVHLLIHKYQLWNECMKQTVKLLSVKYYLCQQQTLLHGDLTKFAECTLPPLQADTCHNLMQLALTCLKRNSTLTES